MFQQKTYDRLAFDRDYKSFFPLSILRKSGRGEERISLSQLRVGRPAGDSQRRIDSLGLAVDFRPGDD